MRKILTSKEMRDVDRLTVSRFGIPSLQLMENAAGAVAGELVRVLDGVEGRRIAVICGKGDNGGDGAAVARLLSGMGAGRVDVMLVGRVDDTAGDARVNFERLRDSGEPNLLFHECDGDEGVREFLASLGGAPPLEAVVDALFGTGLTRPLSGIHAETVEAVNSLSQSGRGPLVVSVDIPSGLKADSADAGGACVRADVTVTFTAPKAANVIPPASDRCGRLVVADIGSPSELVDAAPSTLFEADGLDAAGWLRRTDFTPDSYKGKRGHVLFAAGSAEYSGAAALAANAAMMSGVGRVTVATPASASAAVASRLLPEVILRGVREDAPGTMGAKAADEIGEMMRDGVDCVAVGSGLTSSEPGTRALVRSVVDSCPVPVLVDADGLNALSPMDFAASEGRTVVLTPHEGEFLRLLGRSSSQGIGDRVDEARAFATRHNVILVLKGRRNLVASPDGVVVLVPTGNPGVGKAGGGDTLAGIIAGFVAQGERFRQDVLPSVVAAVYIAGLAGDIAEEKLGRRVMLASDVREFLAEAFLRVVEAGD